MNCLVDTDWVADYLKGRTPATTRLASLAEQGIAISLITFGEIYEGIYFGEDPKVHEEGFRRFLRWVDVLPLNRPIMRTFAHLRGQLRQRGQLISDPDILIAATALYHDLTLITGNFRHFSRIPDLKVHR